jgi:hypothetical protein
LESTYNHKLKEYLALLVENSLIEEYHKERRYGKHEKTFLQPTDKGKRFLFLYNKINNSFSLKPAQKYLPIKHEYFASQS